MQMKGKQKASSLSVVSEQAIEWCNSEVGDETAPIVPGDLKTQEMMGKSLPH